MSFQYFNPTLFLSVDPECLEELLFCGVLLRFTTFSSAGDLDTSRVDDEERALLELDVDWSADLISMLVLLQLDEGSSADLISMLVLLQLGVDCSPDLISMLVLLQLGVDCTAGLFSMLVLLLRALLLALNEGEGET